MQIEKTGSVILNILGSRGVAKARLSAGIDLVSLSNQQASSRLGIRQGDLSGQYRPIYETQSRTVEKDVYETRRVSRTEDVYEERQVVATEDVLENREVTETRDVYEVRAIYRNRDIWRTDVHGDKRLDDKNGMVDAKIDIGADFSVTVGSRTKAVVTFNSLSSISVTEGGTTTSFAFDNSKGSLANALAAALDSVAGLDASVDSKGKLNLTVAGQDSLTIADVANRLFDFSRSPLDKLGLVPGTTLSQVVGTEWAQIGTEQVVAGRETVVVGSERVKTGERQVVIGSERVKTGVRLVAIGTERVKAGTISEELAGESKIVGLVDTGQAGGLGALNLLDWLTRGGLPAGYLEALFSPLTMENAPGNDPRALDAYRADDNESWAAPNSGASAEVNRWHGPKGPVASR